MAKDAQGNDLTAADTETAGLIDEAVRAFTLGYGNANAPVTTARQLSPDCPMADMLGGWLLMLSNGPMKIAELRGRLAETSDTGWNERERNLLAALRLAADGRWASAVAVLDRHLMRYPLDLAAHQCAMRLDSYLGRFHRAAGRSARALPFWSEDQPSYGIMLSFFGFGLEESGDYARAEDISRQAAEMEPYGYWPHHSVSHVMEMTGRPKDGIAWMDAREQFWSSPKNNNCVHIWWHKALFHIDLGEIDEALAIYDREIVPAAKPVGMQLCNLTALLWRLEMLGCEAGTRWADQHALWQQQMRGTCNPFSEIHAAMSALRAEDRDTFETLLSGMRDAAAAGGEGARAYGEIAVPIVEAMADFTAGAYGAALDRLLPLRATLSGMGGSIAQRDLIEWTLTETAIRAEDRGVALSLANERLAYKPESFVNQRFLETAEAIKAD